MNNIDLYLQARASHPDSSRYTEEDSEFEALMEKAWEVADARHDCENLVDFTASDIDDLEFEMRSKGGITIQQVVELRAMRSLFARSEESLVELKEEVERLDRKIRNYQDI